MAQLRCLITLAAVASIATGCRWWRRRHPQPRRADREVATRCYDARFVTGSRVQQHHIGARPAVAGSAEARVFAWRGADGVYAWWEGSAASVRVSDRPATEGPTVIVRRSLAMVGWGDGSGASLRTVARDGSLGAVVRWEGVSGAVVAAASGGALWVARSGAGEVLARPADGDAAHPVGQGDAPALAAINDGFVAAWVARDGVDSVLRGRSLALDGRPRGEPFEVQRVAGTMGPPSLARSGGRLLFAWSDHRSGAAGLHVVSTDLTGRGRGEVQRLSIRYEDGSTASVAGTGKLFGVAWSEPVGGGAPRSYFARVGHDGRRMGSAMRVAVEDDSGLERPSLRWEHAGFVLAMERADGALELRRTGPRGCDMPLE